MQLGLKGVDRSYGNAVQGDVYRLEPRIPCIFVFRVVCGVFLDIDFCKFLVDNNDFLNLILGNKGILNKGPAYFLGAVYRIRKKGEYQ